MSSRIARSLAIAILLLAPTARAHAGQVRIDMSGFAFTPNAVSLNQGDHVTWIWLNAGHSTTSGSGGVANGIWNSASQLSATAAYTWKSDRTGTLPFFCIPHVSFGMTGTLSVGATGAAVANLRITEVHYTAAAGADRIQISNLGTAAGDLARYRLTTAATTGATTTTTFGSANNLPVPAGASVTVHWGASGTNTATDLFVPGVADLGNAGSLGLYAPNTVVAGFDQPTQIVDYVEWGGSGQANEATAANATAGLWTSGEAVVGSTSAAHSISFCGTGTQHGAAQWDVSTPNFGTTPICTTPSLRTSWGRIKSLYR